MRQRIWTDERLNMLSELYPVETTAYTATVLGLGETTVKNKARDLGIGKIAKTLWMERAEYIRNHFHDCSFAEMADKLGISKMSVSRIATQLNLRRTKKETYRVSSRVRKDLIRRERRHVVFGLEPVTNIKVVSNRARVRLRAKLKAKGYVVSGDNRILYYTNDQRRYERREKRGIELGLSFLPLPVSGQPYYL